MRSTALPPARRQEEHVLPGRQTYRARRWALRLFTVAVVAVVAGLLFVAWRASQPSFVELPAPALGASSALTAPPTQGPSGSAPVSASALPLTPSVDIPSAITTASAAPTLSAVGPAATTPSTSADAPSSPSFAPSRALQIYIPNANPDQVISTNVQPLGGCQSVIDPPRSGAGWAGVFGCSDFAQPGTATPSLAVLAGHSSRSLDTVFNKLYRQGAALENQMVYLRTQDSGEHWLSYRVLHTYVPEKGELPYLTAVWGGDGTSTAGRLVLVTCQQNDAGSESTANYVAVAQFVGVT